MIVSQSGQDIIVEGNIKTIGNFQTIKKILETMVEESKAINIIIKDSIAITSSVIGYLTKLACKDKIDVSVYVGNNELLELLDDLGLVELLHVRRIQ